MSLFGGVNRRKVRAATRGRVVQNAVNRRATRAALGAARNYGSYGGSTPSSSGSTAVGCLLMFLWLGGVIAAIYLVNTVGFWAGVLMLVLIAILLFAVANVRG